MKIFKEVIWYQRCDHIISEIQYHIKHFGCHETVFPLRIYFDAFHQKVYCLWWPWIYYNWTVLSSRNAWYFLNIKLLSFWKETHAFIPQKKYKNMYNFVNLNIVVLESLLLRVLIRGNSTKSFVKIFFLLWNTTKTIVSSCFYACVIVISLTSSFNICNGKITSIQIYSFITCKIFSNSFSS